MELGHNSNGSFFIFQLKLFIEKQQLNDVSELICRLCKPKNHRFNIEFIPFDAIYRGLFNVNFYYLPLSTVFPLTKWWRI